MHHNLFGTDGIRGTVGKTPITSDDFIRLGKAIGAWIVKKNNNAASTLIIASDTRETGSLFKTCLTTGLIHNAISVLDAGILPTPVLFYATMQGKADYGIMITASHNLYHDNGIKIFKRGDGKINKEDELFISELFHKNNFSFSYESTGRTDIITTLTDEYITALIKKSKLQSLKGLTFVIDAAHGAFSKIAAITLGSLGAHIISLFNMPNGKNINHECGALHPEALRKAVLQNKAHAGFAFDGDGDRLCVVTQDGTIKDGDDIIAFLLKHPDYKHIHAVVGTMMSNQGLQNHVEHLGTMFYRTPVGDKHVIEKMKQVQTFLGAEPSGHIILRDFLDTSDGFYALIRMVQTAIFLNDWSFTSFKKLPHILLNVPVKTKQDLSLHPFADIIREQEEQLTTGRLLVRYSGTEPLLRIMVEATTETEAQQVGTLLSHKLVSALNSSLIF